MRKWEGDDPGINNQKTPTILLLTPNKVAMFISNSYHNITVFENIIDRLGKYLKNCISY